jgi:tetratricopeptide (TPR) repeat protein
MISLTENARKWIVVSILSVLVTSLYWQVGEFAFVNIDDIQYVYKNSPVLQGLTKESVAWAFTTFDAANWHPLTWLSHMADVESFGLDAGWHHRVNLLLHLLNTALLFLVLQRMTGGLWQSAFVAALFGVHPLHVESVAWVAERKDLLSTLFWILTMGAYVRYVRSPGAGRYVLVAACFASGLMCKPMLVTMPFALLLLDWWPLGRLGGGPISPKEVFRLFREKIPLVVLSAASCAITYVAQVEGGAVKLLGVVPTGLRVSNAIVSYARYLVKTVWPASLAVFYPHPASLHAGIPAWQVAGAALLLAGCSILALRQCRCRSYLAVGWFWYLGTLVPVIGLVQVGGQAFADRYTYVPLIGIFLIVAWGIPEALGGWRHRKAALAVASVAAVAVFSAATWNQAGTWRNDFTLNGQALRVTEKNWLAWNNLGVAFEKAGRPDQAIAYYREAVRIRPDYSYAWYNLGSIYGNIGQQRQAIASYRETVKADPEFADAWNNMGAAYSILGQYQEAIVSYREAVRVRPDYANAWYNLGLVYVLLNRPEMALDISRQLRRIDPEKSEALLARMGFAR